MSHPPKKPAATGEGVESAGAAAIDRLVRGAVAGRELVYRAAGPLDSLWGSLAGREPMPPLWLRRQIGCARPRRFRQTAQEGARQLDEILGPARLRSVLDLGCGCGSMVPYLAERLEAGGVYLGIDHHRGCLDWCRKSFHDDRRLGFALSEDLPRAAGSARFQIILAKSLFTHLLLDEARDYLDVARDALADDGLLVLTAFLFEPTRPTPALPFAETGGRVRFLRRHRPRAAVGFDQALFHELLATAGLTIDHAWYWFWPGQRPRLDAQDLLVCRRSGVAAPSSPARGPLPGTALATERSETAGPGFGRVEA